MTKLHVQGFITHLLDRHPGTSTASVRYRALQQFWKWAAEEEGFESPMVTMKPPKLTEKRVPVLSLAQVKALLAACDGKSFKDRRDTAIIRVFLDTGVRLAELAGITVKGVDLGEDAVRVLGKGHKERQVAYGPKTALALSRYLKARKGHPQASEAGLWLGVKQGGPMTDSGIFQMIQRRGKQAGIEGVHPHRFRHTFSHEWLSAGGSDADLMKINGWESPQMVRRYGASAASQPCHRGPPASQPGGPLVVGVYGLCKGDQTRKSRFSPTLSTVTSTSVSSPSPVLSSTIPWPHYCMTRSPT